MTAETVARWDSFLAKIRERVDETLAQAEEGCAMLLDVNGLDPQPMTIAWMAIETQLHELGEKVDQTFEAKVSLDEERHKGEALRREIETKKDALEVRMFADAARKIYAQAKENLARDQKCAQCGAAMPLDRAFFRSRHLTCTFCNNVNTFVPGSLIASVEYFCCHHLAREKSASQYAAWIAAQHGPRAQAEAALKAHTTAYLNARIEIVPEYAADFEKDLKGKMAFFYER